MDNKKWVAAWSTAPSYVAQQVEGYTRDTTLRYIIRVPLEGERVRLTLSNHCGDEAVTVSKVYVAPCTDGVADISAAKQVTFGGKAECVMSAGGEAVSDDIDIAVKGGSDIAVSLYMGEFARMMAGCATSGPYSRYSFARGDCCLCERLPNDRSNAMGYCYFLTEVDVLTHSDCRSVIAYGDSITSQSWPEWLMGLMADARMDDVSVVRRAVSGSRVLRQYDCLCYLGYGLKGADRFPREIKTAGADTVMILHGVNDIIHPVKDGSNPHRPFTDFPSAEELIDGLRFYAETAKAAGLKVIMGTIMPIKGWSSYADFREPVRQGVNEWIRTTDLADGVMDFDKFMRDPDEALQLLKEYDSGDHLHPSVAGAKRMAQIAFDVLF